MKAPENLSPNIQAALVRNTSGDRALFKRACRVFDIIYIYMSMYVCMHARMYVHVWSPLMSLLLSKSFWGVCVCVSVCVCASSIGSSSHIGVPENRELQYDPT